jgi:hypothetical protein
MNESVDLAITLKRITDTIANAMHFNDAMARITYDGRSFLSQNYGANKSNIRAFFSSYEYKKGMLEIAYSKEHPASYEGPFNKTERELLDNVSSMLERFINSTLAKGKFLAEEDDELKHQQLIRSMEKGSLIQRFLNLNNHDRDVLHDLMPFKVREILLFADLYDAFSLESEGRIFEDVLGEYQQLNLISIPRITAASSKEEVMKLLQSRHFDLIIIMTGVEYSTPINLSKFIKKKYTHIPVFYLLNNNRDIAFFESRNLKEVIYDRLFVWNGLSNVFFAMIKMVEDKMNLKNDTQKGRSRIILLVEDSPKYYSRYLPLLYKEVMQQTKRIIDDVSTDDLYKLLIMRTRPKIILASTYEEAVGIYEEYKPFLLALISDVRFTKDNVLTDDAGFQLIRFVREQIDDLPIIIQSSEPNNRHEANELDVGFIDKNSENIVQQFRSFLLNYLGFGNFTFRDSNGDKIAVATSFLEFHRIIRTIPNESLDYHARRNHFSMWLMARGEIQIARVLMPYQVTDFVSIEDLRVHLLKTINMYRFEKLKGKVLAFEDADLEDDENIISLSPGSYGGKGRGIAFTNTLIHNFDFSTIFKDINLKIPRTFVIGTDEFESFMQSNDLYDKVLKSKNYDEIRKSFLNADLSHQLHIRLLKVLRHFTKPIAVRSSGLFEDSLMQPFAGIFETYLLPNKAQSIELRLKQVEDAIKMVFASIFSPVARGYIQAVNYKMDEERMAVVLQEVVGTEYGPTYYPHISGVAQSYNYYPVAHMKPEDGYAIAALGLGCYVVEGERAYRFSPKHPKLKIKSPEDQYKDSQVYFYAVDLSKHQLNLFEGENAGLKKMDIYDAEMHGSLKHLASVYNQSSKSFSPGISKNGPRVINFSNILEYDYVPMAKTIQRFLEIIKEAMGSAVEIEFALDLNKDAEGKASFYILQIKPLIGTSDSFELDTTKLVDSDVLLFSEQGMGNGFVDSIRDVIYVDVDAFDKRYTKQMAIEIDELNTKMVESETPYILIGPGRWGTRDEWIGIPVKWPQISKAKMIIETDLEGFPLDASSGSHFFHNVTSMNVGYYSIQHNTKRNKIAYDVLDNQVQVERTQYFKHVRFKQPLKVLMDGKQSVAAVLLEGLGLVDKKDS